MSQVIGLDKDLEKVKFEAGMYLEIHLGNMLYPGMPVRAVINGEEMYKVPIKSSSDETNSLIFGYLYIDTQTMKVDKTLSSSRDDIDKVAKETITQNESTLL